MDVKEFAIANLGKTVRWESSIIRPLPEGMIVGYNNLQEAIIVSFTCNMGWDYEEEDGDILLLRSPLNVSLWYIYINSNKRWEVIQ